MSDPQTATADDQRPEAQQPDSDAGDGSPRRRLMSLSSQRRRPEERMAKTKDSKPPEDDPMARALELLSGIDENVRDAETSTGKAAAEPAAGESTRAEAEDANRTSSLAALEAVAAAEPMEEVLEAGQGTEAEAEEVRYEQVIRREDASPVVAKEAKRNPAKALYSLQEVHERTGIPYATLALYSVNHSERIPSLGERRSPAYPRQGLEEFCRIHAENNPDWERPAVGTEKGWDDQAGLARRIDALAEGLDDLHNAVREIHAIVRRGWTAEVSLFD